MVAWSSGTGRYSASASSEVDLLMRPSQSNIGAGTRPPIIYCHGSTQHPWALQGDKGGDGNFGNMLRRLVDNTQRWIFAAQLGPTLTEWGSAASIARVGDLVAWARAWTGWGGPVHFMGASMGHATIVKYLSTHKADAASVVGMIPVTGVEVARENNTTLQNQIDAIWGVTYPTPLPAGADPFTDPTVTAAMAGIPWTLYYADDDGLASPARTQAWAATVGGTAHSVGPLGHTEEAQAAVPWLDLHKFWAANGG